MGKTKTKIISIVLLLTMLQSPAHAESMNTGLYNTGTLTLVLEEGGMPITDEQTIRLTLWKDGLIDEGDINAGVINTDAPNYSNYLKEVTKIPDSEGIISIYLDSLDDFPVINPKKQFLMVEYKDSGDPVTSYQVYTDEYIDKAVLDRFPLIQNGPEIFRVVYNLKATTSNDFTLDRDNTDAGNNVKIVANQGSDPDGIIRYKANNDEWQISNDGGDNYLTIGNTEGTPEETFILDTNDTGGDLNLQFGATLAETLKWDSSNTRFVFSDAVRIESDAAIIGQAYVADDHTATDSDGTLNLGRSGSNWEQLTWNSSQLRFNLSNDLRVKGNLEINGRNFTLDANNSESGNDIDIIANQGSDNDGTIRYNASSNQWEISNDGGAFLAISTGSGGGGPILDYGTTAAISSGTVTTNFTETFTSAPIVVVTPNSSDTIGNNDTWYHISATTTTDFTITADTANDGETFNWIAIGS